LSLAFILTTSLISGGQTFKVAHLLVSLTESFMNFFSVGEIKDSALLFFHKFGFKQFICNPDANHQWKVVFISSD
jgi:hypothetical protein